MLLVPLINTSLQVPAVSGPAVAPSEGRQGREGGEQPGALPRGLTQLDGARREKLCLGFLLLYPWLLAGGGSNESTRQSWGWAERGDTGSDTTVVSPCPCCCVPEAMQGPRSHWQDRGGAGRASAPRGHALSAAAVPKDGCEAALAGTGSGAVGVGRSCSHCSALAAGAVINNCSS